jgi:Subtilase family
MRRKYSSPHRLLRTLMCATVVSLGCLLFGALWLISVSTTLAADPSVPGNIDSHLQRLIQRAKTAATPNTNLAPQTFAVPQAQLDTRAIPGRFDASGRILVHIHLDGTQNIEAVEHALNSQQIHVQSKNATYRYGIMATYLTPAQIEAAARLGGVRAVTMEPRPHFNVGKVTSEGAVVLKTDLVNKRGIKGDGITVGVLSDSFNTAAIVNVQSPPATTADQDVQTGDLPVVNVLEDFFGAPNAPPPTDEGRALCQIVYDLAPHCNLAFATAAISEVDFANNIVALRSNAHCDVIVDDVIYPDEPVFSDGFIAEAVDTAASSTSLPGHPVVYCSSAGNEGDNGYISTYRDLSDKFVRTAGNHGNLKLEQVEPALTAGGWHNWNPNGGKEPVTTIRVPASDPSLIGFPYALFLQWDDVFDQNHGITTDFNILVFDQDGSYHPELSGTSDAFGIQEAFQATGNLLLGTSYQIAITRTKKNDHLAPTPPAAHQLSIQTSLNGVGNIAGKFFHDSPLDVRTTYGHAVANGAIDVAAYVYDWRGKKPYEPQIENFTSPGPVVIYFDQNSNRLTIPEVRAKPEVAGVDGVVTTFFGFPYFNAQFSFAGTSAAAPHVAGVAALVIQAAGGPGSIGPQTVKTVLEASSPPRDIDPEFSLAFGASSSGFVAVSAQGQVNFGPNYFKINYFGAPGQSIDSLTIDTSKIGVIFDTSASPLPAVGNTIGIKPSDVTIEPTSGKGSSQITLKFKKGTFVSGASASFTLDQDVAGTFPGLTSDQAGLGSESDALGTGATFSAKLSGKFDDQVTGRFQNTIGFGFSRADGFGLVDAQAAVDLILGPASKPAP